MRAHVPVSVTIAAVLLATFGIGVSNAIEGPAFPPPLALTFTDAGASAGDPGGNNFTYENIDVSLYSLFYYGSQGPDSVRMSLEGPPADDYLTFSSSSGNQAVWTGTSQWTDPQTSMPQVLNTRFTLTITGLGSAPFVAEATAGVPAGVGDVADAITGADFVANLLFEVDNGGWIPANTLPQMIDGLTQTSVSVGFWWDSNAIGADEMLQGPMEPVLLQNSPNPFSPQTTIRFALARSGRVALRVYDVRGALVQELLDRPMSAGRHAVTWDGRSASGRPVASGTYLYELRTEKERLVRRLAVVR